MLPASLKASISSLTPDACMNSISLLGRPSYCGLFNIVMSFLLSLEVMGALTDAGTFHASASEGQMPIHCAEGTANSWH
eukprot:m.145430 g.145430  ORF g.145430 m.145430 type:complete len:79 (-) comp14142_c0_seq9:190-426(-)